MTEKSAANASLLVMLVSELQPKSIASPQGLLKETVTNLKAA